MCVYLGDPTPTDSPFRAFRKMATGAKVSFNHYQGGKFGTCGTMSQNQVKEMEISQEMHLKMSKKIAQLTKVNIRQSSLIQGRYLCANGLDMASLMIKLGLT